MVDTDDDAVVRLVLNGVDIANSSGSAIAIGDARKVVVMLADGTQNRVSDAASYPFPDATTDEPNAAIFSTADLTIAGTGARTVDGDDGVDGEPVASMARDRKGKVVDVTALRRPAPTR